MTIKGVVEQATVEEQGMEAHLVHCHHKLHNKKWKKFIGVEMLLKEIL